jgi:SAM-dependent methyltransferase
MTPDAEALQAAPSIDPPRTPSLKARQHAAWSSGDYSVVGTTLQIVGEGLCESLDLLAGERLLDVAAGNGNVSLAAARRFAKVTSTDYVSSLLDRGLERARAERLPIEFQEADAEELPFADGSFDVVASSFGVMFTADHEAAAAELVRVCRPGGRIGLASWTPGGFVGSMFATIAAHVPPPPHAASPARWGDADWIHATFGGVASDIRCEIRHFVFRYRSAHHFLDVFRTYYGPLLKAYATLDELQQSALTADLLALATRFQRGSSIALVVPAEYLECVIRL